MLTLNCSVLRICFRNEGDCSGYGWGNKTLCPPCWLLCQQRNHRHPAQGKQRKRKCHRQMHIHALSGDGRAQGNKVAVFFHVNVLIPAVVLELSEMGIGIGDGFAGFMSLHQPVDKRNRTRPSMTNAHPNGDEAQTQKDNRQHDIRLGRGAGQKNGRDHDDRRFQGDENRAVRLQQRFLNAPKFTEGDGLVVVVHKGVGWVKVVRRVRRAHQCSNRGWLDELKRFFGPRLSVEAGCLPMKLSYWQICFARL